LTTATVDELRRSADSLIENIGALQYLVQRVERQEGYLKLMRDLLADARVIIEAHGHKPLVKKIDKALKEVAE